MVQVWLSFLMYVAYFLKDTYTLSNAVSNENLIDFIHNSAIKKHKALILQSTHKKY
jgi:hypothetical protein